MTLTVGSLFSGIGGLDLGLERAGMRVIWQSEIDPFCCKILKKHWPGVVNYGDIRNIEWQHVEQPDVICGGYPCQPFSNAGKRQGEQDPRHLWPVMFDAICNLRPRYAIMENVRGHLSMGFGTVLRDLAKIGFNAEWQVLPAAAVGAPQKRERLFIVAYPNNTRGERSYDNAKHTRPVCERYEIFKPIKPSSSFVNEQQWLSEPRLDRVATGIPQRVDRLKGLGNAVVPQIGEYLGRCILDTI
jgi:DNA (cytosine-5)-methyltransferase 1